MYNDDEFLALSGIQHFSFCRRQWALIHIEQAWSDNYLTTDGELMHKRAHDEEIRERRGDKLIVRGAYVHSSKLGLSGQCDVIEFRQMSHGFHLADEMGLWSVAPVEYKHGASKTIDADRMQLCAQAMCLEEMLVCEITKGYLFYGKSKKREEVILEESLRKKVISAADEMHSLYKRQYTPKVKVSAHCRSCSLYDICLPHAINKPSASAYIDMYVREANETSA